MPTSAANNEPNNHQAAVTTTRAHFQSGAPVMPCAARNPSIAQAFKRSRSLRSPAEGTGRVSKAFRQVAYNVYAVPAKTFLLVM